MPRRNAGPRLVWVASRRAWYISWTEAGRNLRRSAGRDRAAAQAALAAFLYDQTRQAAPGAGAEQLNRLRTAAEYPIREALLHYAQERGADVAAPRALGCALGHLAAFWADRMIADITPAAVDAYRRQRQTKGRRRRGAEKGAAPATVDRELTTLKAAIRWAHKNSRLIDPPAVAVGRGRPGRDRWLTPQEAAALLAAADAYSPPHVALFVRLALFLGARHGAILDLTWDQVDLRRRLVILNPPGRQQTAKRRPELAIPETLMPALIAARVAATGNHVVQWRGKPIRSARRGFAAAVRAAGLTDVTPHTLRHTCATWLAQAGVPLWTVAGFLGHGDIRTTARYAHHAPGHLRDAAAAIDRMAKIA